MSAPFARVRFPLVQAPMAGAQGSALAVAVCRAGGIGSLPGAMLTPDALSKELATIRASLPHDALFNVNFFCHQSPAADEAVDRAWFTKLAPVYREFGIDPASIAAGPGRLPFSEATAEAIAPFAPPIVSFHFGLPSEALIARCRAWGAQIWSSATTVAEARWLAERGVDAIIAQGLEAGGHRGHFLSDDLSMQLPMLPLTQQICRAVATPVIAAGGIVDAQSASAAMSAGAAAVQVGTAFLRTPESTISKLYRDALASEAATHTALTNVFTGRPARGIVNRFMREYGPLNADAPAFPLATRQSAPLRAAAEAACSADFTPLWAGQNAPLCEALSAAEIVKRIGEAALAALRRAYPGK